MSPNGLEARKTCGRVSAGRKAWKISCDMGWLVAAFVTMELEQSALGSHHIFAVLATNRSMMHIMGATRTLAVAADAASTADRRAKFLVFHFLLLTFSRSADPFFGSESASCVICVCLAIASGRSVL